MIEKFPKEIRERLVKKYPAPEFKEKFLQTFAEAVSGRRLVYLYRILSEAATQNGTQIAFTTENERTKSKDADSTATKDGSIRTRIQRQPKMAASVLRELLRLRLQPLPLCQKEIL